MTDARRDPWAIVLYDPDGKRIEIHMDGIDIQDRRGDLEVPVGLAEGAICWARLSRQPPEFRLRGRGPQSNAGLGWTWAIAEGW